MSNTTNNIVNCQSGVFLSADTSVTIIPLPAEGMAIKLFNKAGTKMADKVLAVDSSGKYHRALLTSPNGGDVWINIPVDHKNIKWSNNIAYALVLPEKEVLTADEYWAL